MAIESVFVYADGQIGFVTLPVDTEPSNWRRVIRKGSVSVSRELPTRMTAETEEFDLRGHMFNGRPIYCATNFDVQEAYQEWVFTKVELRERPSGISLELQKSMDRFVCERFQNGIDLDRWDGRMSWSPEEVDDGLELAGIEKRGVRRIVAVCVNLLDARA